MPKDQQPPKELKVTDKRIFTPEGDIREEFRQEIRPADPLAATAAPPVAATVPAAEEPPPAAQQPKPEERQRSQAEKAANPGTRFTVFLESLIVQAYMSLGMLPNPYGQPAKVEPAAARQMIDILTILREKTAGNLEPEESDFLETHLGELKLAYVQRTKSI